jgi:sugar phosphate isomerase/epimerase
MRLTHPGGGVVHLAYCTNVHPAEDLDGIVAQLHRFAAPVRARLGWDRLGVGLWLAAPVAHELARDPAGVERLRATLDGLGLEVVTLNGFPHTGFHAPVVKHAVYRPDWSEPERLTFTVDLVTVLAGLLPDDVEAGSISTVPLGWRDGWTPERARRAHDQLLRLGDALAEAAASTGRRVRVAIEPEPGCVIERTDQLVSALDGIDVDWIGACVDACHAAVVFEDPAQVVATLASAGVPVVKAQLSSALRSVGDHGRLAAFTEPRFLHQVRARRPDGTIIVADDLDGRLIAGLPADAEARVHFHVPIHHPGPAGTQAELVGTLDALLGAGAVTDHLEVETYTWSVLPGRDRSPGDDDLVAGLAAELAWAAARLADHGLRRHEP